MDRKDQSSTSPAAWEHFAHGADIGVRGFGPTQAEAFAQAARAMCAAIVDPKDVRPDQTIEIEAEAPSADVLLIDWLNALVYEMAARRMIFGAFDLTIAEGKLKARAYGEKISRERHAPAVEVKGATFTQLEVREDRPGLWRAQCVVDV
ncbi:MAG TPA: archease [Methylocystis sp.]|nr:archease [Methylocystis sp.]